MKRIVIVLAIATVCAHQSIVRASQFSVKVEQTLEEFRKHQREQIKLREQQEKKIYDNCYKEAYLQFLKLDPTKREQEVVNGIHTMTRAKCVNDGYHAAAQDLGILENAQDIVQLKLFSKRFLNQDK